jgi:predicted phosphoribosyltransferase
VVERRFFRARSNLAHRAYTLRPTRPLGVRVILWVLVCALGAAGGAAASVAWQALRAGTPADPCKVTPVAEGSDQAQLARTRLALAQESAARAAVQIAADSAAAEVARLSTELQFLRGQSKPKPPAARR